jgi:uncharacterized membrane protein
LSSNGLTVINLPCSRDKWNHAPQVTLVVLGTLSPDIAKIKLLVPETLVEALLGIPLAWRPLYTPAGSLVVVALWALLTAPASRKRAFLLLALGAASHHALDVMLISASGYAYPVFWPLTDYRPPRGMLYLSSDRWPAVVAGLAAALVWVGHRYSRRETESTAGGD